MTSAYDAAISLTDRYEDLKMQAMAHTAALEQGLREDAADPQVKEEKTAMLLRGMELVYGWLQKENASGLDAQVFCIELTSQILVDLLTTAMDVAPDTPATAALMAMSTLTLIAAKRRLELKKGTANEHS